MAAAITVSRGGPLTGTLAVPGDKSITHRALMLAALARGESHIRGALDAGDTRATAAALVALGAKVDWPASGTIQVQGCGGRWRSPAGTLDLGNSGTGMRLLAGALAGRGISATLDGDASLRRRPMERITAPLRAMGATLQTRNGCPPITVAAADRLHGIAYRLPVASAQVKSALLLAGLAADGPTRIVDPFHTRDHTERMLPRFGAALRGRGDALIVRPGALECTDITVPADASSAAFLAAAALLVPGSRILLPGVGANPTRTGFFDLLGRMGASLEWRNLRDVSGEPVADLHVEARPLTGVRVEAREVPRTIDELPALMVLAAGAAGETVIEGADELRHKESDRIEAMRAGLETLGTELRVSANRIRIPGGGLGRGGRVEAACDHRVAMALALAGLATPEPVTVAGAEWIDASFPDFAERMRAAGVTLEAA
ncbi:MAG: 3-phosphoshikimate 1-carboxyvinyltransferase [Gammaproteobacteria bacterium]|nr:3-phosphoshikimate 1-carboxyvinyltransferase [Gammaproteobacteria bacterium]